MKQYLFLAALSGLALVSCTQVDDVPEVSEYNAIGFENVVGKNTRAVTGDMTVNNFDLFSVTGYYTQEGKENNPVKVFDEQIVEKNNSDSKWYYSPVQHWIPGSTYYFYAYSCADVKLEESGQFGTTLLDLNQSASEDRALEIQNFVCNDLHQHDLIVAKNEKMVGMEKTADLTVTRNVAFKFEHALSKINAVFTSKFPVGYDLTVSDVKIVNYYDKADFDFDPMNWKNRAQTAPSQSIALDITKGQDVTSMAADPKNTTSVTTGSIFMIPMEYSKDDENNKTASVEIQFTVTVKQNGIEYLTRKVKGVWQPTWQKGWAYTYYIELGGDELQLEPITFESSSDMAEPNNWGDSQRVNMTFSLQ